MSRGLAYNRDISRRKAKHKKHIAEDIYGWSWYHNLHQYSKNKVHCSCGLCRSKTNAKKLKNCGPSSNNWNHSDLIKIEKMNYQEKEN